MTKALQLVAILTLAVAMAAAWAHLLEMPTKMTLSREDYLTVQQIYRGWALLGIVIIAALVATAALTWQERRVPGSFRLTLIATLCLVVSLGIFFAFTFPANQATENWTVLPDDWHTLRQQWEWSHAVNAILYLVALASLVLSVIRQQGR